MTMLEGINGPEDLKGLSQDQLGKLATEIRDVLVETVTRTSGHLGPNLGVVELTIAHAPGLRLAPGPDHLRHRAPVLRAQAADRPVSRNSARCASAGGLSGYPSRRESEHDLVENSHASTSLSYADGLAKAYRLRGETDRTVVAVIGDGALTGGMAWEALNNIAIAKDSRLVIVVNDNGRSYQPTIGGLATHLATVRVTQRYEHVLDYIKTTVTRTPIVGSPLYGALHGAKKGLKDFLQPQVLFEDLGIKYVGPIDGHDEQMLEHALRKAADYGGPVIVHAITRKGFGYLPAEQDQQDQMHQVPARPKARRRARSAKRAWSRRLRRRDGRDRHPPSGRGRDHRRDAAPRRPCPVRRRLPGPGLRRRHRRAARDDQRGGPGHGRPAPGRRDLLDVPQPGLRPAADGRGPAPAPGHRHAGPGGRHRPGRRQPQRHVGRLDPAGRPGPADGRAA